MKPLLRTTDSLAKACWNKFQPIIYSTIHALPDSAFDCNIRKHDETYLDNSSLQKVCWGGAEHIFYKLFPYRLEKQDEIYGCDMATCNKSGQMHSFDKGLQVVRLVASSVAEGYFRMCFDCFPLKAKDNLLKVDEDSGKLRVSVTQCEKYSADEIFQMLELSKSDTRPAAAISLDSGTADAGRKTMKAAPVFFQDTSTSRPLTSGRVSLGNSPLGSGRSSPFSLRSFDEQQFTKDLDGAFMQQKVFSLGWKGNSLKNICEKTIKYGEITLPGVRVASS